MGSKYYRALLLVVIFTLMALAACRQAPNGSGNVSGSDPAGSASPSASAAAVNAARTSSSGTPDTMEVKVFFSAGDGTDCSEVRAVTRTVPQTQSVATAALRELFKGPTQEEKKTGMSSFFSEDTKDILDRVNVKDGAAYVNLDGSVIQKLGNATSSCGSQAFTASVEETLKQFPTVKKVFFAIEGSPRDYYDWVQIGECPEELRNCDASNF